MLEMKTSRGPIDPLQVAALEQYLGHPLPTPYRQFLLEYNGGRPKSDGYYVWQIKQHVLVDGFYSICEKPADSLLVHYAIYQGRMPRNLLPIGWDPFGNQYVISLYGEDTGKVYFWHHEHEYLDGREPDYHNVSPIADSFDQFAAALVVLP